MLTESEFVEKFAQRLVQKIDGLKIHSTNHLEIRTEFQGSNEYKHFLDNCYSEYLRYPDEIEEIFERYLNVGKSFYEIRKEINLKNILPVIKDGRFIKT